MAFLSINGTEVEILQESGEEATIEVGDKGRMFEGTYMQRVWAVKREWSLSTKPFDRTTLDAYLESDSIFYPGIKSCNGTLMGNIATNCALSREKIQPIADGVNVLWIVHFKLYEQ